MNDHGFDRVGRERLCPICEHADWCLVARDGTVALCQRVEQGSVARVGDAGWLHRLKEDEGWRDRPRRIVLRPKSFAPSRSDLPDLAEQFRKAITHRRLVGLAQDLGVTSDSLARLETGWCSESGAYSFPMRNAQEEVVGIRLRTSMGKKFAVRGGREGLFLPLANDGEGPLLITEGPTDTAAALDLGFAAIGRPSCRGGRDQLEELLAQDHPAEVVIVSDNDGNGQGLSGAEDLARRLRLKHAGRLLIMSPPPLFKDLRGWVRAGASRDEVRDAIDYATLVSTTVILKRRGERDAG